MLSFSGVQSAAPSSVRSTNTSPGKARFAVSDLGLDGGTARQGEVEEVPAVIGVDTRDRLSTLLPFTPPSLQSQIETEGEQSEQLLKAIEKQSYQEAITAYTEKAAEIRAAAENIRVPEGSNKEVMDIKGFLEEVSEKYQAIQNNMTSFRRSTTHSASNMQFSSYPPSPDSEPGKDMRVALYNQAITAYMKQELFFSTVGKIGNMVTI